MGEWYNRNPGKHRVRAQNPITKVTYDTSGKGEGQVGEYHVKYSTMSLAPGQWSATATVPKLFGKRKMGISLCYQMVPWRFVIPVMALSSFGNERTERGLNWQGGWQVAMPRHLQAETSTLFFERAWGTRHFHIIG